MGWPLLEAGERGAGFITRLLFRLATRPDASPEQLAQALAWMKALLAAEEPAAGAGTFLVHGALAYRAAHYEDALRSLERAEQFKNPVARVGTAVFLAMAHARQGKQEPARLWLGRAEQAYAEQAAGNPEYEALLKEAAQTVGDLAR